MIKFTPPERGWRAWLRRHWGYDWRAELDALDKRTRLEIGRIMTSQIHDPARRAELEELLDQAEGQMQEGQR